MRIWTDFNWLRICGLLYMVKNFSIKDGVVFLDYLSDHQLLKKDSVA
jgi:hypothetical protein